MYVHIYILFLLSIGKKRLISNATNASYTILKINLKPLILRIFLYQMP